MVNRPELDRRRGVPYILERRDDDVWVRCNVEEMWIAPLFFADPSEEGTGHAHIPSDGPPGRYRVTKQVAVGERHHELSFELDVVA